MEKTPIMKRLKAIIYILLAAICWSFLGPLGSVAIREGVQPTEIAFWRSFMAAIILLLIAALTKEKPKYHIKDAGLLLGWSLLGVFLNFIAYMFAVQWLGNGLASILLYTAPLWIILFSISIYKEWPRQSQWGALFLGLLGMVAICWPQNGFRLSFIGICFGLASGLGYAFQYFFNHSRLQKQPLIFNLGIVLLLASFWMLPFVSFSPKGGKLWINLLALSLISTVIAYMLWGESMKILTPVTVSIIALLEPVLAVLWGILFFDESASWVTYLGGSFVLISALMITLIPTQKTSS